MHKPNKPLSAITAAAVIAFAAPTAASPETKAAQTYRPDFSATIGGKIVGVDIALLGPNGEETVGFYATLDGFHGPAFGAGWSAVYKRMIPNKNTFLSTDPRLVSLIKQHVSVHGIRVEDLENIYKQARELWQNRPELRSNTPG